MLQNPGSFKDLQNPYKNIIVLCVKQFIMSNTSIFTDGVSGVHHSKYKPRGVRGSCFIQHICCNCQQHKVIDSALFSPITINYCLKMCECKFRSGSSTYDQCVQLDATSGKYHIFSKTKNKIFGHTIFQSYSRIFILSAKCKMRR